MKKSIKDIENKISKFIQNKKGKVFELDSLSRRFHASPFLVIKIMDDFERQGRIVAV